MRNNLKNVQYLLFVLFMFALTGCGASNLAGTSSSDPGNITAKVVFDDGKSTAKSVGLIPPGVTAVRFKVTGPYTDPVAKTRYTTTKATFPGAAGGGTVAVSPGTGLLVTVLALGEGDLLDVELFSPGIRQSAGYAKQEASEFDPEGATLKELLDRVEAQVIDASLRRHRGNKTRVAEELGLTRVGLRMKLGRLGLGEIE